MRLTIDFETRSRIDLKKRGVFVYAADPSTEVICLAGKWGNEDHPWVIRGGLLTDPSWLEDLEIHLSNATEIEAHNMQFEAAIWQNVCVPRYGWPPLPVEKLRCSAAKAAMHALPRRLEDACKALGLPIQKDMDGHKLMMKMCKPRKDGTWHETPEQIARLCEYCKQDVLAEEALSNALRDLPPSELEIWRLDQIINQRGIQADIPAARAMLQMVQEHESRLLSRLAWLTRGAVRTAKQVEQLKNHLRGLGVDLPDLAAATVKDALKRKDLGKDAKEILEIRQSLARSSASKYQAILDRANADGRIRGSLLYHGAGTGRWSGAGIQPQNLPSRIKTSSDPSDHLDTILAGGLDLHEALHGDDPMSVAGACVRPILTAGAGCDLVVADYSAIEGRGLAWLAGEETELEGYRAGRDPYITSASLILHKPYDQVTKDERQSPGKISVLACGYQGSAGAVRKFGGEGMTDEEIVEQIVRPWRDAHPMTTRFWYDLEAACTKAVTTPRSTHAARGVSFRVQDKFLLCRLPAGRLLYYFDPRIQLCDTSWGEKREQVTYMTVDSLTKKWVRTSTYGGKLAENVTQAICRDLMAEAMLRVEAAGYPIVLTVHDELVAEVPHGFGSVEEFEELMAVVPSWATGFPLKAAGWQGKRYRK